MNYINTRTSHDLLQKTLKRKIQFSGVGVHNGRAVSMSIEPAEADTGIIFIRSDLDKNNVIKAIIDNVVDSRLCTKIKKSPVLNHGEDLVPNPDEPLPVMWWIASYSKQCLRASNK